MSDEDKQSITPSETSRIEHDEVFGTKRVAPFVDNGDGTLVRQTKIATEAKQDDIIVALENANQETVYPAGAGSNGSVTLTNANTAYAVPTTASTAKHILVLYNGSDTDLYWGFANSNANGILLPPDGRVSLNLGASEEVYAYCASASKVITYSLKEIK